MDQQNISVRCARVNNLKGISTEIPRGKLIVITGVSGSGKSSLAFDTLYAEGQRRYVESLSAYARQFLGKMAKPEVDFILGLPPAIAIEQKVNTRNPRSTVGTSTEIYDYLRMLFGRVGHTYSPVSGEMVKKHTVDDVVARAQSFPEGTRIALTAPVEVPQGRTVAQQLDIMMRGGYSRIMLDGAFTMIEDVLSDPPSIKTIDLLVDRLQVASSGDELSRLADSAETAFFEGNGKMSLLVWSGDSGNPERFDFSTRFEADGMSFREPNDQMFNFNNPYGACATCEGFGKTVGIDPALVVPDPTLSVYDDAVFCWRGEKMSEWKRALISVASRVGFPIHKPYCELSQKELDILWHGVKGPGAFSGIDGFFRMVDENQYKVQYRVLKARYRGKTTCPDCHGSRLKPDAAYVKVGGRTITELVRMPVAELRQWFDALTLDDTDRAIARRLLTEIRNRLGFLCDVGLGYLTLDRLSTSLSGGESQRINLATSLGSSLVGSMYILDEPSIGLHPRDTERLIGVLRHLRDIGNTVIIVEHDSEIMRAADYLIDVGPDAGTNGGEIVWQGALSELPAESDRSYTVRYLNGQLEIPVPRQRRQWRDYIEVTGAREHNLKDISVKFPLGIMTVVTGVSGSGKSTLVRDILYRALVRELGEGGDAPGLHKGLRGDLKRLHAVEFVDQNPIGRSSRSNAATYLKAFDEIRRLYAEQQSAKQMGFTPGYFSFNAEGGRCEECKGEGTITIEMQFMADIVMPCEACHGRRYKQDVLDIQYRGRSIADILDMSVDEAVEFFSGDHGEFSSICRRILQRLQPLHDVGLGYIRLGQSSSSMSGGENQRVKLAYYLSQEKPEPTMFIFDEPTTGLHLHDISTLLDSLNRLVAQGHTVVIIEHNVDVIKCADHVIDIGPDGGDAGGQVVAVGTPEQIAACPHSHTGRYLRPLLP